MLLQNAPQNTFFFVFQLQKKKKNVRYMTPVGGNLYVNNQRKEDRTSLSAVPRQVSVFAFFNGRLFITVNNHVDTVRHCWLLLVSLIKICHKIELSPLRREAEG